MRQLMFGTFAMGLLAAVASPQAVGAEAQGAYLGVGVESLHPALVIHLPETLLDGQGVMITHVAADSPAAKAGLKAHEILVTYDGQKLFSPEQLVKLVHADKPGHKVKLDVVQNGKIESHTVALGQQPSASGEDAAPQHWWQRLPHVPWRLQAPKETQHEAPWKSFDSLSLKKLDNDRFKAEIEYLDQDGKKQQHAFEGTRDEIRKQIEEEKDLPANEKKHLMQGLDLHRPIVPDDFWSPYRDLSRHWYDWDPFNEFDF